MKIHSMTLAREFLIGLCLPQFGLLRKSDDESPPPVLSGPLRLARNLYCVKQEPQEKEIEKQQQNAANSNDSLKLFIPNPTS